MKKNHIRSVLPSVLLAAALLGGCARTGGTGTDSHGGNGTTGGNTGAITDDSTVATVPVDTTAHSYALVSQEGDSFTYRCDDCGESATVTVSCLSGTAGCVTAKGTTLAFSGMTEDSVYALSGTFYGNLVVEGNPDCELELELNGLTLTSAAVCPLTATGAGKLTLSAKKGSENYLSDARAAVTDENAISAAVWADCDLGLQGKGSLYVSSVANNGIHTKDDLKVKNLYLQVECEDNALKGNDSVTVESGTLVLIARTGDGIKTTNSDLSQKGKQRGTVAITGGDIRIYAACDGIDAAYDVTVDESSATVTRTVFTDKYSKYSGKVTATKDGTLYLRTTTDTYRYSLCFYNESGDTVWCNPGSATKISGNDRYYAKTIATCYCNWRKLFEIEKRDDWKDIHIHSIKPEFAFRHFLFDNKLRQIALKTILDFFWRYPRPIADLSNGCISIFGMDGQLVQSCGNLQTLRITKRFNHCYDSTNIRIHQS